MKKTKKALHVILVAVLVVVLLIAGAILMILRTPGWHSISGKRICYSDETGKIATGYQLIDDKPYYFTRIGLPQKKGWIEDGEGTYYCKGCGELTTGWQYLDNKAYYFYEDRDKIKNKRSGVQAKNYVTSGGLVIGSKGYLEGDEALAIAYALDVLDRYGWNLEAAYKYSSSLRFVFGSDVLYGFRIHKCAIHGFKYGGGNCLTWAGTFCVMAKVLGYDCRLIWGTLPYKGEQVPHGWTEIWEDDGIHVYDPRKNEGKDMAGFDVRYGEKGSRKYNEESKQYLDW